VLLQHDDFVDAVGACALHFAAACAVQGEDLIDDTSGCAVQADYPAWFLQQRPASAMQELSITWEVPLAEVKQLVELHLQQGGSHAEYGDTYTWQGRSFRLSIDVAPADEASEDSPAGAKIDIGCYLQLDPRGRELCKATYKLWLLKAGSSRTEDALKKSTHSRHMMSRQGWGNEDLVCSGAASSWPQVERALRAKQAVHADGCLHIQAVVSELE
jgi:hypothetical protein